jgi:signal transduction histidine kinase
MPRVSLFRSSGFRLSVAFTALFLLAAAIAGATAYSIINEELHKRHERALAEQMDFFEAAYKEGGITDLAGTVEAYVRVVRDNDSIFLLEAADGARLAGNIDQAPVLQPCRQAEALTLGIDDESVYFIQQRRIGPYRLTVGASAEDLSELDEIVLEGALWAALILLAIAVAGGVALSRRMNDRIALAQTALERVAEGHFEARIPRSGNGDDIDTLTGMMNAAVARLGASVESIRQISNDISHDLKTPLNRLRISLEEALEKQTAGIPVIDELNEASSEASRIIGTFDALLRIAQIESGARKARFETVDLSAVASDVVEFYRAAIEDAGMRLTVRLDEPAMIVGDRELLTQLWANLIENVLHHCEPGTSISFSVEKRANRFEAVLADDGPGIPADEREKVLRRLYRLDASRQTPGSGLGLSMVKAIADLHEATLDLEDNGPGLRVRLRFAAAA